MRRHSFIARLGPSELVRLSRAQPMDAVQEPAYHSPPENEGALSSDA